MQMFLFLSSQRAPGKSRKRYYMVHYRFIMEHYTNGWLTAEMVAVKLDRSTKSIYRFIERNPALQKHPRNQNMAA